MAEPDRLDRNVRRYRSYTALSFTPFMLPVIVLFWQENGLDLFDIFLLQGLFALAIVLLEVPTGMVADRLGKRMSLIAASLIAIAGMTGYALGRSFGAFLLAEILLSFAISFQSGASSALLYDSLKAAGRQEEFKKFEGQARGIQMVVCAACNLIGGVVGSLSYRATVWLSVLGPLLSLWLALGLVEVQAPQRAASWREGLAAYHNLNLQSWRFVSRHRLVRWQIAFMAVLLGSGSWLLWLYQPYMAYSGLPVWAFGAAFTIFNLFAALMSHLAHQVDRYCRRAGTIGLLIVLHIAPLALMTWIVGPLSFLFILGHQAVRGLTTPIFSDRILRYTYADKRATVLSISSLSARLFFALTAPLIGLIARNASMTGSIFGQALILSVVLGILLVAYLRIPDKYFQVKSSVISQQ